MRNLSKLVWGKENSKVMDGVPLLWEKSERFGFVQPEEENALECPNCSFPVPESLEEIWRGTFYRSM